MSMRALLLSLLALLLSTTIAVPGAGGGGSVGVPPPVSPQYERTRRCTSAHGQFGPGSVRLYGWSWP
jgi:hypothetical protein